MARLRFQLDEHIPYAVAVGLRRRGIDVITSADAGLLGTPDTGQLAHALAHERVMVTFDADLLGLNEQGHQHAGIAYFPGGRRSIGILTATLILMHEVIDSTEMAGHIEYL